jgi:hypothetical protein
MLRPNVLMAKRFGLYVRVGNDVPCLLGEPLKQTPSIPAATRTSNVERAMRGYFSAPRRSSDDMSRQGSGSSIMVNLRAVAHSSCPHPAGPRAGDPFDDVSVHRAMARDAGFVGAVAHHRRRACASRRDLCARYLAQ